jgi:hypothetical protein
MTFIEPGAQFPKNSRIQEMSKNFQFFLKYSRFTILPSNSRRKLQNTCFRNV